MILFVGDSPSPKMKPDAPAFAGAVCEPRLEAWISIVAKEHEYYIVNKTNPAFLAILYLAKTTGAKIVALGNNASKALGDTYHFKLPHPSGRNRQLNNKQFVAKKLKECKKWLVSKQR